MARAHLFRPATDREGNLLYGATVTVRESDFAVPINQPLYSGPTGSDELPNPFTASSGVIDFWLEVPQRVSLLVEADGQSDAQVWLDAPPPPEQIVATDFPLEIVNTPSVSGQVLLSTSTAGQAQWGNPPTGTGLTPVVVAASQSFSSGADPSGWSFVPTNGGGHSYDAAVLPPGTNYIRSLKLTQSASNGTVTVTGPTVNLLEAGRVSMWIKSDMAPTETFTVKIVDSSSVQTTQVTISQDQDWGFFAFDLAPGTWYSLLTYTGQTVFDATTSHSLWMTGYVAQYGGQVPPHSHSGTGAGSVALGTSATASATGATAVGSVASATGTNSTAYGYNASAAGNSALAAGYNASAPTDYSLAVGAGATGSGTATAWAAVGQNANASGQEAVAVGKSASAASDYAVAIGSGAAVGGAAGAAVAIGQNASAQAPNSLALGTAAQVLAAHNNSVALGANAVTTSANQIMMGNNGAIATVTGGLQNLGIASLGNTTSRVGFYGQAGNVQQTVAGSDDGNVTLRTLVQALASTGLIVNNSLQQPMPFKSPVGVIDYFYHQDPGDGTLGVADFDFQPYAYFPMAYSAKNPYPAGPQWYVGTDHNGYKGFATGLGAAKNVFTPKQSFVFNVTTTGTANKVCIAIRHTGASGSAAAAGYLLLDQASGTISLAVKNAGNDTDTYTLVGAPILLSSVNSTPFNGSSHSHIVQVSGTNVFWCDGAYGTPVTWSAPGLNATGTYAGIDFAQTGTQLNGVYFVPQEIWDSFPVTGSLTNAASGEPWWPVTSGAGASVTVSAANNIQLTSVTGGYSLAYLLTATNPGTKWINTIWPTGTTPSTSMGIVGHYVDGSNYFFINNSQITKVLAGTQTTLTTLSSSFVAGDRMQVSMHGTNGLIQVYRNGTLVGSAVDSTSSLLASPRFGLGARGAATANFGYLWIYDAYSTAVTYK